MLLWKMTNRHYCIREPTSSRILITSGVNTSHELMYYQPLGLCRFSSHDCGVHPSSGCFLHDCHSGVWMREKRRIRRLHLTYHTFTPPPPPCGCWRYLSCCRLKAATWDFTMHMTPHYNTALCIATSPCDTNLQEGNNYCSDKFCSCFSTILRR